jgi:hypothetical protein
VERQRVLFFEGEAAESLWVLRRGQVRLYKASANGRVTTLETLGPGRIFGAISALDEETYPASAEGVTAGLAWCLPRGVLLRLLAEHPRTGQCSHRIGPLHGAPTTARSADPGAARLRALLTATRDEASHAPRLAEASAPPSGPPSRARRFEREDCCAASQPVARVDLGTGTYRGG